MPINYGNVPQIDFSPLAKLGDIYQQNKMAATRERTLAELAKSGNWQQGVEALAGAGDLEGASKIAQIAKLRGGDPTDELKEYNFAVKQGFQGSFVDFKTALKRAGATNVNVNTGEREYDKVLNKAEADRFVELQKGSAGASKKLSTLGVMEKLTENPDFYSGVGAERFVLPIKQGIAALGGDPTAGASMEAFRSLANKSLLEAAGGSLGTAVSNADASIIANTVPNLGNTPEGNRKLIQMQKAVAKREQEVFKLAREYAAKNNGRIDAGFDEFLADWANKNPLFPNEKPPAAVVPQPARTPPPAQGGAPVRVKDKAERDALPPGTPYIAPDGSTRIKQ